MLSPRLGFIASDPSEYLCDGAFEPREIHIGEVDHLLCPVDLDQIPIACGRRAVAKGETLVDLIPPLRVESRAFIPRMRSKAARAVSEVGGNPAESCNNTGVPHLLSALAFRRSLTQSIRLICRYPLVPVVALLAPTIAKILLPCIAKYDFGSLPVPTIPRMPSGPVLPIVPNVL